MRPKKKRSAKVVGRFFFRDCFCLTQILLLVFTYLSHQATIETFNELDK